MQTTRRYQDSPVDVRLRLSVLWIAMLFVFAYVDIFGFYRRNVLAAALDGRAGSTGFAVDQLFLTLTLVYVLVPVAMTVLSLLLPPPACRWANVAVGVVYLLSIAVSCVGEDWTYYLVGSLAEVVLLAGIARVAWTWPPPE